MRAQNELTICPSHTRRLFWLDTLWCRDKWRRSLNRDLTQRRAAPALTPRAAEVEAAVAAEEEVQAAEASAAAEVGAVVAEAVVVAGVAAEGTTKAVGVTPMPREQGAMIARWRKWVVRDPLIAGESRRAMTHMYGVKMYAGSN